MRFMKSHCTGFEYSKDSSIVYMDISCDVTADSSNKNNKYNNTKIEIIRDFHIVLKILNTSVYSFRKSWNIEIQLKDALLGLL